MPVLYNRNCCSGWFSAPQVPNDWSNALKSSWKASKGPVITVLRSICKSIMKQCDGGVIAGMQAIEETGKRKLLSQAIEVLLTDEQRPGAPATFSFEQFMQIMALACETPEASDRPVSTWTPRELADEAVKRGIVEQISPRTVERFLKRQG